MLRQTSNHGLRPWHLVVLAAGTFVLGTDGFVLSGLLPAIARDLSVGVAAAGQLTTLFAVTYAIGSPVIAAVTGTWDRRVLLGGGLAVFLLGMAGQATGTSFALVAAGRVLAALGAAAFQANAYAVAGVLAAPERRGRALAAVTAGSSVSTVVGVPFGVAVGQAVGWRGVMWIVAGLAAVVAATVPVLPRAVLPATSLRTRLAVLARPQALALLASTAAVLVPVYLVTTYVPLLVGSTARAVVLALLATGVGLVAGNRVVGRLVDLRGAVPTLVAGAVGVAGTAALLVVLQLWLPATVAALAAVGFFSGLTITPQQHRFFTLMPDVAPVALGLNGSAIYVGGAVGAALGGIVVTVGGASWLPVVMALAAALAALFVRTVAPERRRVGA